MGGHRIVDGLHRGVLDRHGSGRRLLGRQILEALLFNRGVIVEIKQNGNESFQADMLRRRQLGRLAMLGDDELLREDFRSGAPADLADEILQIFAAS
ncbi:hypothetical protein [Agrobacterium sp. LMR679]|uniref:hypothetical protein n=1 Tax=Agrobacterium sp. LMR679 TaxID=3014335 RepID=UPI0022AF8DA5|nr:hypothetical protein [Agrobacterium sp. LMR679]MCZ4076268.1 hypothetical protein [Agrobacterium sp. LMR679]